MFDVARYDSARIEYGESGFPVGVVLPAGDTVSSRTLSVSPGGIIRTSYVEDGFLLAYDGITAIDVQRQLSADFYNAASDADESLVYSLQGLFNVLTRDIDHSQINVDLELDVFSGKDGDVNPVLRQAADDIKNYSELLLQQKEYLFSKRNLREMPSRIFPLNRDNIAPENLELHVDGIRSRSIWSYVGLVTEFLDVRISEADMKELCADITARKYGKELQKKYEQHKCKTALGNALMFKGSLSFDVRRFDAGPKIAVRELLVHKSPQVDYVEPRYAVALT